jgi:ATP-binding cassette subfamily F protein 3
VRAKKKMLERLPQIIIPEDPRESIRTFHFPATQASGYRVISLEKVSKSYGEICVYKDFDFEIIKGEKAVLVGENGAGKSTLLKILSGVVNIDAGTRKLGHNTTIGYFSQTRMDVLTPDRTVLEEAYSVAGESLPQDVIRTILAAFLFRGDDVEKKVKILSGGEKSRLILAKLLIRPPNFLLLDEPTTHLDVDAVEALIKALTEYEGTIVFISHDIYFVKSIANNVYEVKDGKVTKFPGNFDYYLHKKEQDKNKVASYRIQATSLETDSERQKTKDEAEKKERRLTGEEIKKHNEIISNKIKKLRKKKEKLQAERYAKNRVVSNPRHGQDIIKYYTNIVSDLDKRINEIEAEIASLKNQFLQE